jgi:EpsI family protein
MEATLMQRGGRWRTTVIWLLLAAGLTVAFANNFAEMWMRWFPSWHRAGLTLWERTVEGESYYTHGPLVPLVSFFIVLLLIRYTRIPCRPSPGLGFTVLALSLLGHLLACLARVNFASGFALIGVLAGLVLVFWGREALRRLWFPLAFLIFMVPLPEQTIADLNFRLKMLAADAGCRLADLFNVVVVQSGNRVYLEGGKVLVIANVCNGLRTLITVIAFGAIYVYVCQLRGFWRFFLFLMSVPVALAANSLRILGLIVVADVWDEKVATGSFHSISGIFIFIIAFLLMFGIERLILWAGRALGRPFPTVELFEEERRTEKDEGQWTTLRQAVGRGTGWAVSALIGVSAAGALYLNGAMPSVWDEKMVKNALPSAIKVAGQDWRGVDLVMDEQTLAILETRDYLLREYVAAGGARVQFCIIFSKDNRKGTHPPDLCLAGSGDGIVAKGDVTVTDVPGRGDLPCRELIVQHGQEMQYVMYVYKCGNSYTGSFWKQQWVILLNGLLKRNASGALIRVSLTMDTDNPGAARKLSTEFLRVAVPYVDKALP